MTNIDTPDIIILKYKSKKSKYPANRPASYNHTNIVANITKNRHALGLHPIRYPVTIAIVDAITNAKYQTVTIH